MRAPALLQIMIYASHIMWCSMPNNLYRANKDPVGPMTKVTYIFYKRYAGPSWATHITGSGLHSRHPVALHTSYVYNTNITL